MQENIEEAEFKGSALLGEDFGREKPELDSRMFPRLNNLSLQIQLQLFMQTCSRLIRMSRTRRRVGQSFKHDLDRFDGLLIGKGEESRAEEDGISTSAWYSLCEAGEGRMDEEKVFR